MSGLTRAGVLAGITALVLAPVTSSPATAAPRAPEVVDLGTLGGGYNTATEINERGQVAGTSETTDGQTHAFLWERGKLRDLGTLGGPNSYASAISDNGHVVGGSDTATGERHAFLWYRGRMTDLGTAPGGANSTAFFVSDDGQVVVQSATDGDSGYEFFVWRDGVLRPLAPAGRTGLLVNDMNGRGQVVGAAVNAAGQTQAFSWYRGAFTDLPAGGAEYSHAADVNERGVIVGLTTDADGTRRPALWTGGRLSVPPIDAESVQPTAVNDRGDILGNKAGGSGVFFHRGGVTTEVAVPGQGDLLPLGLNNRGEVLVEGSAGDVTQSSLWRRGTATPLPGLAPDRSSSAADLNDRGELVGSAIDAGWRMRPVLWRS